jgi:hypothetical protein
MFKRFAWYWTGVAIGLGFPIALISLKYDLFISGNIPFKITGTGLIVIAIIVYFFKDQLADTMATLPDSKMKSLLTGTKTPMVLLLICVVVLFAKAQIEHILFILGWSTFANVVAIFPKYKHLEAKRLPVVKKEKQTKEAEITHTTTYDPKVAQESRV